MKEKPQFFDFAAEVGLTKHIGGTEATDALVNLCEIVKGSLVLDVGCGVGVSPCYLAQKYGCQVVGVDILEKMVVRSRERAKKLKLHDRVEFKVADAQDLPFEDDMFDAVITESVTAFSKDKQRAVSEYVRVTKSGGYVGLNETVWLKVPPPPEIKAWAAQDVGATVEPLPVDEWVALLKNAGLTEIHTQSFPVNTEVETRGIMRRYGMGGMLSVLGRTLRLYARSADYRKFVRKVKENGITPENLVEYFGYGLFVGRK